MHAAHPAYDPPYEPPARTVEDAPVVLDRRIGPYGEVVLRRQGGVLQIIANGCFLMDTSDGRSERLLVDVALEALDGRPTPSVLIGGLGVGFSLAHAAADPRWGRITVVEREQAIIDWHGGQDDGNDGNDGDDGDDGDGEGDNRDGGGGGDGDNPHGALGTVGHGGAVAPDAPGAPTVPARSTPPATPPAPGAPLAAFSAQALADPRTRVLHTDLVAHLRASTAVYDALCLDIDNGPGWTVTDDNEGLYSPAGLAACRTRLTPGGVLAVWSAQPSPEFEAALRNAGFQAVHTREIPVARGVPDAVHIAIGPGWPRHGSCPYAADRRDGCSSVKRTVGITPTIPKSN
jgi:spermidine synthase